MSNNFKVVFIAVIIVFLLVIAYLVYNYLKSGHRADNASNEEKKNLFQDFEAENYAGDFLKLSGYTSKGCVVLNFWASWCGPCGLEMPEFDAAEDEYKDSGVTFVMINSTDGSRETKETALAYLNANNYSFDNVLYDTTGEASEKYMVTGIPTTFVINKNGEIVKKFVGTIDKEQLAAGIELGLK